MPGGAAAEGLFLGAVAQLQLRRLDRTDGADDIAEDLLGAVCQLLAVAAPSGDVIGIGSQQDEIIALTHVHGLDDLPAEGLPGLLILQCSLPQGLQQPMLRAVHDLLGGEGDGKKIFVQRAGKGLFQQRKVDLLLVLLHPPQ